MKENNKQELSYFRLKLRSYMSEHHPERLHDTEFITARADMALTTYCDAVVQGFTHPEAESIASEVYPYAVTTYARVFIVRPSNVTERSLITTCTLQNAVRSDNNPQGFLMEHFVVRENQDLQTYKR